MNYIIDPKVFSAVFTVPAAVADKHLKLARGEHIKVLLYIMRNMSVNPNNAEIAAATGLSEYDVAEALLYWEGAGILMPDGKPAEKADRRAAQHRAGDGDALRLSLGKPAAALRDLRVHAVWQR